MSDDKNLFDDDLDGLDDFSSADDSLDNQFEEDNSDFSFDDINDDESASHFEDNAETDAFSDDDNHEEQAPKAAAPIPESKPFLKTPIGMGSIAACVVAAVVVGSKVSSMMSPDPYQQPQDTFVPDPVVPVAQEAEFRQPFGSAQEPLASEAATIDQAVLSEGDDLIPSIELSAPSLHQESKPDEFDELREKMEAELNVIEDLKAQLEKTNDELQKLKALFEKSESDRRKMAADLVSVSGKLTQISSEMEEKKRLEKERLEKEKQEAEEKEEAEKVSKFTRLPDLIVVDKSANGEMLIIKKLSNGRVFTMFKGENIITPYGRFKISEVDSEDNRLIVGDKYYIDDKTPPAVKPVARRAPAAKPAPKKVADKKPAEPTVSKTLSLSAVFDNGTKFGVVDSKGEFKVYKIGDRIPGAGIITGLDDKGQLKSGTVLIPSEF